MANLKKYIEIKKKGKYIAVITKVKKLANWKYIATLLQTMANILKNWF